MKKVKGNVILLMVFICALIALLFLYQVTSKRLNQPKTVVDTETQNVDVAQNIKDSLNGDVSNPLEKPPQVDSELSSNEIQNPFITQEINANADQGSAVEATQPQNTVTSSHGKQSATPPTAINTITTLPNGQDLPLKSGYISSYPIKNNNGVLKVMIDNKASNTDLLVFLHFKKPFLETKNIDRNELSGVSYIKAGNQFEFSNLDSGHYRVSWVNLHTAKSYQSATFQVHRDNLYAYDKLFTFNNRNLINNNKVKEIATAKLYTTH